jgi:hypothetical protein
LQETQIMADIVSELAAKCGISPELVKKGLGAVLAYFKTALPADSYAKLSAAVPGTDDLVAEAAKAGAAPSGGVLGAVGGAVSKLFGGGGGGQLLSSLTGAGFSPDQLQKFLPGVMESLKGKLPDDVLKKVSGLLPVPETGAK